MVLLAGKVVNKQHLRGKQISGGFTLLVWVSGSCHSFQVTACDLKIMFQLMRSTGAWVFNSFTGMKSNYLNMLNCFEVCRRYIHILNCILDLA